MRSEVAVRWNVCMCCVLEQEADLEASGRLSGSLQLGRPCGQHNPEKHLISFPYSLRFHPLLVVLLFANVKQQCLRALCCRKAAWSSKGQTPRKLGRVELSQHSLSDASHSFPPCLAVCTEMWRFLSKVSFFFWFLTMAQGLVCACDEVWFVSFKRNKTFHKVGHLFVIFEGLAGRSRRLVMAGRDPCFLAAGCYFS